MNVNDLMLDVSVQTKANDNKQSNKQQHSQMSEIVSQEFVVFQRVFGGRMRITCVLRTLSSEEEERRTTGFKVARQQLRLTLPSSSRVAEETQTLEGKCRSLGKGISGTESHRSSQIEDWILTTLYHSSTPDDTRLR